MEGAWLREGWDKTVKLWDAASGRQVETFACHARWVYPNRGGVSPGTESALLGAQEYSEASAAARLRSWKA